MLAQGRVSNLTCYGVHHTVQHPLRLPMTILPRDVGSVHSAVFEPTVRCLFSISGHRPADVKSNGHRPEKWHCPAFQMAKQSRAECSGSCKCCTYVEVDSVCYCRVHCWCRWLGVCVCKGLRWRRKARECCCSSHQRCTADAPGDLSWLFVLLTGAAMPVDARTSSFMPSRPGHRLMGLTTSGIEDSAPAPVAMCCSCGGPVSMPAA